MYAFWSGYFYGNYSIVPGAGSGIMPYGYYNMQSTSYGFNRNHLLCGNYGYAAAYSYGTDRVTPTPGIEFFWTHQFF